MCGIIGYLGFRRASEVLVHGLKALEYRGYDSAGVAVQDGGRVRVIKRAGRIEDIEVEALGLEGTLGIGHTRWATHGEPADRNAHPLWDCERKVFIVHNGTLENADELIQELEERGHRFSSDTDSEVIAHLIEEGLGAGVEEAVLRAVRRLRGSFAFVVMVEGWRGLIGVRKDSPLILGIGDGEFFLSSDAVGFLRYTDRAVFLENGMIAIVRDGSYRIVDFSGRPVEAEVAVLDRKLGVPERMGHRHFMHKEIHEQPEALRRTLEALGSQGLPDPESIVYLVASGTSYHASLIASYILSETLGILAVPYIASEFAYRRVPEGDALVILTTQSGETADVIKAARRAKGAGLRTLAITNTPGSSITREVDGYILTKAGVEVSVAATKTFTSQLLTFLWMAREWGAKGLPDLEEAPRVAYMALSAEDRIADLSALASSAKEVLYLGRGTFSGMAMEGALKMKEISYIHAEAFPAGELKHGPLALVDDRSLIVSLVPSDELREKNIIAAREVRARGGRVVGVSPFREELGRSFDHMVPLRDEHPYLQLFGSAVILQLLAYHTAVRLGRDVDRPRNLAKSVTVE